MRHPRTTELARDRRRVAWLSVRGWFAAVVVVILILPKLGGSWLLEGRASAQITHHPVSDRHVAPASELRQLPGRDIWVGPGALVRLRPGASVGAIGFPNAVRLSESLRIYRVEEPGGDGEALASRLQAHPDVLDATADYHYLQVEHDINIPPNDPRYGGQWYLERIGIESAWEIEDGTPETSIVIVDNGCEMAHPDLELAFVGGRDVRDRDDDPSPSAITPGSEHGTACAGIVAGVGNNEVGIAGVCPECTLHCVRLLGGDDTRTSLSADIAAFEYARDVGAAVVSNSWGFTEPIDVPPMLGLVIESLYDEGRAGRGTLVVFASGNDNRELRDEELTGVRGVLNVGAVNLFDESAPFSNFGASVDLTAPTGTVTTDLSGPAGANETDYTDLFGGTSSACPVVAGVAGLLFSARPDLTAREAHDAIVETARPAPFARPDAEGHDPVYGFGIVDPTAALRRVVVDAGPGLADAGAGDAGVDGATAGACTCDVTAKAEMNGLAWLSAWGLALMTMMTRRRRR